ncbi:hypothetical protein BDZ88DRAFT_509983 [Geranomyces variabilis]|nr:hypothetical protein BDZ88DRAFT_509983 [Geranomyces variabilis]KAJ3140345.1 hypothetical protein HDU90_008580 [Geranomyces variabilis]
MGFVTVLVQHAWALQPTSSRGTTPTTQYPTRNRPGTALAPAAVSLTPETVTAFLHSYAAATTTSSLARHARHAADILSRLHHIVLGPALALHHHKHNELTDKDQRILSTVANFKDPVFIPSQNTNLLGTNEHYKPYPSQEPRLTSGRLRRLKRSSFPLDHCLPAPATRLHALKAREALVAFARDCPDAAVAGNGRARTTGGELGAIAGGGNMRIAALEYLYEALDCGNELRCDAMEVDALMRLVRDLSEAMRAERRKVVKAAAAAATVDQAVVGRMILVRHPSQNCLSLAVERLEQAHDLAPFPIGPEDREMLKECIDELQTAQTDDPFVRMSACFAEESLQALFPGPVTEETVSIQPSTAIPAIPTVFLAQSLRPYAWPHPTADAVSTALSQVRAPMPPPARRRLLSLLAAGASRGDECSAHALAEAVLGSDENDHSDPIDVHTVCFGARLLAAVVQRHERARAGQIAMEEGLIPLLHKARASASAGADDRSFGGEAETVRLVTVLALAAVWISSVRNDGHSSAHTSSSPASALALLALEQIRQPAPARKPASPAPAAPTPSAATSPAETDEEPHHLAPFLHARARSPLFRISHLFTYKAAALAAHLLASLPEQQHPQPPSTPTMSSRHHRWYYKNHALSKPVTPPLDFITYPALSTAPYHRTFLATLGISTTAANTTAAGKHHKADAGASFLAPSFLTARLDAKGAAGLPTFGTANRRKLLFHLPAAGDGAHSGGGAGGGGGGGHHHEVHGSTFVVRQKPKRVGGGVGERGLADSRITHKLPRLQATAV